MNDYITTTKQSTTKPCAYLLGYTVDGVFRAIHVYISCDIEGEIQAIHLYLS